MRIHMSDGRFTTVTRGRTCTARQEGNLYRRKGMNCLTTFSKGVASGWVLAKQPTADRGAQRNPGSFAQPISKVSPFSRMAGLC